MAERARRARDGREGGDDIFAKTPVQQYEARLGKWLGPRLYSAVSDLITLDKLASYAKSGMEEGLGALGGVFKDIDPSNAAEVDQAVAALQRALGPKAAAYVKANGAAFQESLQGFVDANPMAIVLIAMLAAAGAVAADMDIPELEHTFQITPGLGLTMGVELGTLRNVTIEKIHASVDFAAGDLKANAAASFEPNDDKIAAELGLDYKINDNVDLYGRGSWAGDVHDGSVETTKGSVRGGVRWRPKPNMSVEGYGEYDQERGAGAGINFKWTF